MKRIPIRNKYKKIITYTIVDDKDYIFLNKYKWCKSSAGYIVRNKKMNGRFKTVCMHREILNPSKKLDIDHINRNPLDNRRINLRACTRSENMCNSSLNCRNKSGFYGVSWNKEKKKWVAQIWKMGKNTYLGRFNKKEDAAKAYNKIASKIRRDVFHKNKI